jgi:hypothetical protein
MSLVGEPEGKSLLRIPKRVWVDNSKMELREVHLGGVD